LLVSVGQENLTNYQLLSQETFTKTLLLPAHHVKTCWSLQHKKTNHQSIMLAYPLQEINFPKAEIMLTTALALA
jgi:hypothetical protein